MARSTASPLAAKIALALAAALLAVAAEGARAPSPAPAPGPAPASGSSSSAGGLSTDKLAANGLVDGHGLIDELAAVAINATAIAEASSSLPPSWYNTSLGALGISARAAGDVTGAWTKGASLKTHNNKRKKHVNTPPLGWSWQAANVAKNWAKKQVAKCTGNNWNWFFHNPNRPGGMGENLYASMGYMPNLKKKSVAKNGINSWYDEIDDWSFATSSRIRGVTGHFTQLVWKNTDKVGAYVAVKDLGNNRKCAMYVANYVPPGNYGGQYAANVMPLK